MKKVYFIKEYNIKNSKLKIEYTGYCNENISISGIEKTLDNTFNTYNDKLDLVTIIKYLEIIFKILEDEYLVIGLSTKYKTIPVVIQMLVGSNGNRDMGAMMAMLVLAIIPIVVFYLACQKHIIEGVVAGAVKG